MLADNRLSPVQIGSLFIAWSLTAFLFEVPAGAIADKFSRRNVLIIGILIRALGYSLWLLMPNYFGFMLGFILWGIKGALTSGTLEALVYDELKKYDSLDQYAKVTGRAKSIGLAGDVLATSSAIFLVAGGYKPVLVLSIVSVLLSGLAIYALPKAPRVKNTNELGYLATMKIGVKTVLNRPLVFYLVAFMGIVGGLAAADEFLNLFLREKGFDNQAVVFWAAVVFLMGAGGSWLAHKLEGKHLPAIGALVVWALLLFSASLAPKFIAPLLIGLYIMFFFAVDVLFNAYLQREIGDETRATTTSVGSFVAELFAIIGFLIVGISAHFSTYAFAFKLVAATIILFALLLALYIRRHKLDVGLNSRA